MGQFFEILDKNKNGELSSEEVVAATQRVNPAAKEDDIKAAREWAIVQGGTGIF